MKKVSSRSSSKEILLTIYNEGFGAVKETREVNLTGSETELVFSDVAQLIETDSLLVEGLKVLEFNYDYDLVDRKKILEKYIDKEVYLISKKTDERRSCRLLSVEETGRCVLENIVTKEIYIDTHDEIILPSLPSGLMVKPALVWKIGKSTSKNIKVSYLCKGLKWEANYVAEIMEKTLNIEGWAEIENQSGTTFENARVKLIAGDVKKIQDNDDDQVERRLYSFSNPDEPQVIEKSFFDYHMYTLLNTTTLKDNQTKQINILNGLNIPYKKYYKLDIYDDKVNVVIEFSNKKDNGLGYPLPKGKIKFYKADDSDNSLEFIGEDTIGHTPIDEDVKLTIGNAFDITFNFHEVYEKTIKGFVHHKYVCVIKNHKEEKTEVRFYHTIYGIWEMVFATHEYKKKSSNLVEFTVNVPASSEMNVEFEYKVDKRIGISIKKD